MRGSDDHQWHLFGYLSQERGKRAFNHFHANEARMARVTWEMAGGNMLLKFAHGGGGHLNVRR